MNARLWLATVLVATCGCAGAASETEAAAPATQAAVDATSSQGTASPNAARSPKPTDGPNAEVAPPAGGAAPQAGQAQGGASGAAMTAMTAMTAMPASSASSAGAAARGEAGAAAGSGPSDSMDAEPQEQDPTGSKEEPAAESDDPPAISCPPDALSPGDGRGSLMHDGVEREFLFHVPQGYDNTKALPLVLNFHGASSSADQQRSLFSQMNPTADAKGFIVVYPQGIGASWNAGACCGDAVTQDVDDVGFARALVTYMGEHACVDNKRVYATGFSNGGRMSYRLGCEAADVFAALAPVAGTKSFPDLDNTAGCTPSRPISLIDFMGTADPRSAAQPGQIAEWVAFNGCSDAEPSESYRMGEHYCMQYSQCEAGTSVTYCLIDGGDHCWPGSYPCPLGQTSRPEELSANELMWELFERSSL